MQGSWTFQSKEQAAEMQAIADHIILPYRKKLMPKVIRFEGEFVARLVKARAEDRKVFFCWHFLGQLRFNC